MTRPKVPDDRRRRTRAACEICKRRKQKCNGKLPCANCDKRGFACFYQEKSHATRNDELALSKQRMVNGEALGTTSSTLGMNASTASTERTSERTSETASLQNEQRKIACARMTSNDAVAEVYCSPRLLEDPAGRLLYVGDSATLAHLQFCRVVVEGLSGPCPFTTDPQRHRITENMLEKPPRERNNRLLPNRAAALVLAESFFVNTKGILQALSQKDFATILDRCYSDPLDIPPANLCLVNLVFAIGLVLAIPLPGTNDAAVINKLHSCEYDRSEMFFLNAKDLIDPTVVLEDDGYWSIQALFLMSFYMLTISKRNTAWAYLGMAIRTAFTFGLHREETLVIYAPGEQEDRKHLFQSLYVLDRFLSASLGRPLAIQEGDCSESILRSTKYVDPMQPSVSPTDHLALEAAVRSCRVISLILRNVYQKRKISTNLAQELADECREWENQLDPSLHWRQLLSQSEVDQGMAILHVNLLYCHSLILITRPFFSYILGAKAQKKTAAKENLPRPEDLNLVRMKKFADTCVIAATHSLALIQSAYDRNYLPKQDPFIIYFLLAASLVVFANEFSPIASNPYGPGYMKTGITVMRYCAERDMQARRLLDILTTFADAVRIQKARMSSENRVDDSLPISLAFQQMPDAGGVANETAAEITKQTPGFGVVSGPGEGQQLPTPPTSLQYPTQAKSYANSMASPSTDVSANKPDDIMDFDTLWQVGWDGAGPSGDSPILLFGRSFLPLLPPVPSP